MFRKQLGWIAAAGVAVAAVTAACAPAAAPAQPTAMMPSATDAAMMASETNTAMMANETSTAMMAKGTSDAMMMAKETESAMMTTGTPAVMMVGTGTPEAMMGTGTPEAMMMGTGTPEAMMMEFPDAMIAAHFVDSMPMHKATLDTLPAQVVVNFDTPLNATSTITIAKDGKDLKTEPSMVGASGKSLDVAIPTDAGAGLYLVKYKACVSETECQEGQFAFAVK